MRSHSYYPPQEIVIKILHFLPFASILECKRVSKEWKSLINDPKFYNLYRDKSLSLLVNKGSLYCVLIRQDGNKLSINPPCPVHRIPIDGSTEVLVSEPSNAVACVGLPNNQFLFYNLFTGTSYKVVDAPIPNLPRPLRVGRGWVCYGFGYDHYADDHKIMVVCNYKVREWLIPETTKFDINTVQREDNSLFWVYSFRNHAWKTLQGFPYVLVCTRRAYSLNGVLHWVVKRENDFEIVTYDLHTRRFGEISAPPVAHDYYHKALDFIELGGQLCYENFYKDDAFHVWVMNESWTNLFSIDCDHMFTRNVCQDDTKVGLLVYPHKVCLVCYESNNVDIKMVEYDAYWEEKRKQCNQ